MAARNFIEPAVIFHASTRRIMSSPTSSASTSVRYVRLGSALETTTEARISLPSESCTPTASPFSTMTFSTSVPVWISAPKSFADAASNCVTAPMPPRGTPLSSSRLALPHRRYAMHSALPAERGSISTWIMANALYVLVLEIVVEQIDEAPREYPLQDLLMAGPAHLVHQLRDCGRLVEERRLDDAACLIEEPVPLEEGARVLVRELGNLLGNPHLRSAASDEGAVRGRGGRLGTSPPARS